MLRKWTLVPLVVAAGLAVGLGGCSGNNKPDVPKVRDKPQPELKKMTPGGPNGKSPGRGSSSE